MWLLKRKGGQQKGRWEMKVRLGQLCMTRGIAEEVAKNKEFAKFVWDSLKRHASGDWGDVCKEDWQANNEALIMRDRLLSAYKHNKFKKIWIITEWDRSATTILFPEEY
jgi:hypothetical protein